MASSESTNPLIPSRPEEPSFWLWAALLTSLVALAGSLYLSLGMNLKACPLCFYQRTFVMGVVGVLATGFFMKDVRPGALSLLALPLAGGALAVAGFHVYLELTGVLECPAGILAVGTAPQQSLAILAVLTFLLIADQLRRGAILGIAACMVLGGLFAFGGIKGTPPAPTPTKAYEVPVNEDGCRKPFRGER